MNSCPIPVLACTDVIRSARIVPTSQAANAVVMNSAIFVLATGTPTLRAAGALPPAAKIQFPALVRSSTQVATAVTPSHQKMATRNCTPNIGTVEANRACARPYPGTVAMPLIWTLLVIALVTPRLMPCSIRNVPSVMMKLGSFVRITRNPLRKPIVRHSTSPTSIADQTSKPYTVESMARVSPLVPVSTPADRSNSPPIISMAIATAMMPSVEAGSSQLAMPSTDRNTGERVAKKVKTAIAPTTAPSSGRISSRRSRPTWATRSSAVVTAVVMVPPCGRRGARGRPATTSACALVRVLGDRVGVGLVDEARSGQRRLAATDHVGVGLVEVQVRDRQVPLQVRLLVDREQDLAGLDRGEHVLVQVERGELRLRAGIPDRVPRRDRDPRVEGQYGVDRLVRLQLRLDLRAGVGQVTDVDLQVLHRAELVLGAGAPVFQSDVARLVDHAQRLRAALGLELLTSAFARDPLGLPDMGEGAELLELVNAGVDGDHRDARGHRLLDRLLERIRVGHRHDDAVDLLAHRVVDQLRLLGRVAGALVGHLHPEILAGLLGAALHHVPELVARAAVGDHGEAQIRCLLRLVAAGRVAPTQHQRYGQQRDEQSLSQLHGFLRCGGGSDRRREVQMSPVVLGLGGVRPTAGHDLGLGVERDAFGTVDVRVAEQRVLPAAERVEGHRHRDRHVDADHADPYRALEPARGLAA